MLRAFALGQGRSPDLVLGDSSLNPGSAISRCLPGGKTLTLRVSLPLKDTSNESLPRAHIRAGNRVEFRNDYYTPGSLGDAEQLLIPLALLSGAHASAERIGKTSSQ